VLLVTAFISAHTLTNYNFNAGNSLKLDKLDLTSFRVDLLKICYSTEVASAIIHGS